MKERIKKELALRELAKRDFYFFLKLKWERYNLMPFMQGWHINYLCKVLECTQPNTCLKDELIRNLIINMPPSYGKTEIIARSFIAWSLGKNRARKFFYISYSDDLCRKIANQVRDLMKSQFYKQIFPESLEFLQDNASEFVLREGGGLFVTTLKSALTGFHAHQILIDDPIKVSEMTSKKAVNLVNQNFKESVLSRLQDNDSNITILMQRLGTNDLCGFLQNEREFDLESIKAWKVIKLKAMQDNEEEYKIKDFSYLRKKNEPLFKARHSLEELESLKLKMGNDEFSGQYLQEPLISSGGYFDESFYTNIFNHEISPANTYIFIDNAMSLKESADNRAIIIVACENYKDSVRYCVLDCFFGIWSEEETIKHILQAKSTYKDAHTYIESDGGGLVLHRLLMHELAKFNQKAKEENTELLNDDVFVYTPSRKISKVQKIKSMRPFYNSGLLVFSYACKNQEQIKKELFSFNPDKPFRKDDCIDALASALAHSDVKAPIIKERTPSFNRHTPKRTWRI
ncbi:phage-related CUP0950-like protein [Helicobacter cetorum]|uniref:Phage-related CUP0950-like protein n=1 Tax=Helicobacter cetorum (strain ATCC BAA-429 / MIT 00-7128) TaxID=182217 RepID=I0ELN5_HELC0|nr:phage-related CUP0950-like protein [Helicobacter cetorum]AFI03854.1 phage-related CUP0950-like protein [Helicobacter cetorum MIT 00-7128]